MSERGNPDREKQNADQPGAVENADDPQAEQDVTSGGAPDDPDTPEHVYGGETDDDADS